MTTVKNVHGKKFDFEATVGLMDNEIREELHAKLAPCSHQQFFNEYVKSHFAKFGKEWELAKTNPVW